MRPTRSLILTAIVLAALLCAAGCTGTGTDTATPTPTTAAATTAPATTVAPAAELTVFAAASLRNAFNETSRLFEANHPGTKVVLNFDGSQVLRTQLQQGAYADVFASANWAQMNLSKGDGRMVNETVRLFCHNRLASCPPGTRRRSRA
jgi:molybdate transport system substrate-binding protein